MPKHKSRKCKSPDITTTAGILSTLGVASVGTLLSFKYAADVASVCLSTIQNKLGDAVANLADKTISIESHRYWINTTIDVGIQQLPSIPSTRNMLELSIPVDTPSVTLRILDIIGNSTVETLNSAAETVAKAISENLCYNEVLAHGLAVTLTLTGLLALLTYTCYGNQNLKNDVVDLREKTDELQAQLNLITKAIQERQILDSQTIVRTEPNGMLSV